MLTTPLKNLAGTLALAVSALAATPSLAAEVNIYTSREPALVKPVFELSRRRLAPRSMPCS